MGAWADRLVPGTQTCLSLIPGDSQVELFWLSGWEAYTEFTYNEEAGRGAAALELRALG